MDAVIINDISVLSKFFGPVGQSDIFLWMSAKKNFGVPDLMSDRKYKNIHLVKRSETQVTIKDNNEVLCHLAVFVDTRSNLDGALFPLNDWK